jgi:diguanylate cyclase (GGDEF)-like protein
MKKLFQLGPVFRLSIGIVCLMISLVLVFDSFFDLLPSDHKQQTAGRRYISRIIGDQASVFLAANNVKGLQYIVDQFALSSAEIVSIGIRRIDNILIASTPEHPLRWGHSTTGIVTSTHVIVPLFMDKTHWGEVQIIFTDLDAHTLRQWLLRPDVTFILLFSTLGFIGVYFYLRRALHYLNPSQAVPQRVRTAFDTLTEAVLIINAKNEIMLANAIFHQMNAGYPGNIEGKSIMTLDWLVTGLAQDTEPDDYPWTFALRSNQTVQGKNLKVVLPDGLPHEFMMNCSPINDGTGIARGCLVTFDDITELSQANALLTSTLRDLELSRDKIQEQNEALQKYAHFDHLTGCLNRRAFFDRAEPLYETAIAGKGELVCIMTDIDHFKSFNDRYGHPVGDSVIQQVSRALSRSLRSGDLLCRYGGEEFCILLADTDTETALEIAERIRSRIEKECGAGVRSVEGLNITSSFGMAALRSDNTPTSLAQLIEQADQGLYCAKKSGRNRVADMNGTIFSGADPLPQFPANAQAQAPDNAH